METHTGTDAHFRTAIAAEFRQERRFHALGEEHWDLLVVGGGVTGSWIARDAGLRGLRVALVEAEDFSSGASSQNLRTIHGGLRYLQHLDVRRTRESIRERSMWLRVAPHLVEPLPFVLPTYRRGLQRRFLLRSALAVADLAGWDRNRGIDASRHLAGGRSLSREECLQLVPEADAPDLTGAVVFQDAQMYSPDRLVLAVLLGAMEEGACVINHAEATQVDFQEEGFRVICRDGLSGDVVTVRARTIVNATGSRAQEIAGRLGLCRTAETDLTQSIGLNLVVEHLGHSVAFATEGKEEDPNAHVKMGARRLFVVPWRGRTLIGTAHYHLEDAEPVDVEDHARRFLSEVNSPGTGLHVRPGQVLGVQWGLLPATRSSQAEPVQLLRHHRLHDHAADDMPGAFSITSVKFTTGRLVAEQVVDRVVRRLGRRGGLCRTSWSPLPGGRFTSWRSLEQDVKERGGGVLPTDVLTHLAHAYGDRSVHLLELAKRVPRLGQRVQDGSPVVAAELVWGVQAELARTVEDLLHRRTAIGARGAVDPGTRALTERVLSDATQG